MSFILSQTNKLLIKLKIRSMKRNYDEASVVRSLSRKGIKVDVVRNTIEVPYNSTSLGNGSWGKIDFLCNHRKYILLRVGNNANSEKVTVVNPRFNKIINPEDVDGKISKRNKSEYYGGL